MCTLDKRSKIPLIAQIAYLNLADMLKTSHKKIQEISIPVPWGFVSGKTWGNEKDKPILCFHGIMDNAGTFDRLIPYLPNSFYYICIDLPGHGRSSHFPPYLPVYTLNYIIVYMLVAAYFKQKSYTIIGHSYGGQIGFLFAQLYPESVDKLVMLDTVNILPVSVTASKDYLVDRFEQHLRIQEKLLNGKQPTYTYEEALEKIQFGRNNSSLTKEAAEALMHRVIIPTEDGRYRFSVDPRIKNFMNPLRGFRYIIDAIKKHPIRCPVLLILGKDSSAQQMYMKPVIAVLEKQKNIIIKRVDGNHDVHNDHPEIVAPYVIKFLLNQKGKL